MSPSVCQRTSVTVGVRLGTAVRVGRVHGIRGVAHSHHPAFGVVVHRGPRRVHGDLFVVHPEPGPVRIGVGEPPGQQDLPLAYLVQRVVRVRPHLGQIERAVPVGVGLFERHDLHLQRPVRVLAAPNSVDQIALVVVRIPAGDLVCFGVGEAVDALVGDEVVLDPEALPAALIQL
jgi:hypothetical protein